MFLRARARLGEAQLDIRKARDDDAHIARGGTLRDQVCYRYVRVTELLHAMKEDFNSDLNYGQHLFNCCRRASILVLDDLTSQLSQWELAQLDYLIDRRYGDELKTIITSNHSLERLKRVLGSERIPGRIGEVAHMKRMKRTYR
jgi:DNA replication protein DnaC